MFFFVRKNYALSGWIDPLFFAGAFVLGGGLLSLLARFGAFDTVVYGFRSIFKHMNPNYTNAQDPYPDYYAYSESKKEKRKQNKIFPETPEGQRMRWSKFKDRDAVEIFDNSRHRFLKIFERNCDLLKFFLHLFRAVF